MKVTDVKSRTGSVNQRYGSEDPDPHQNVTDPEHYFWGMFYFRHIDEKNVVNVKHIRQPYGYGQSFVVECPLLFLGYNQRNIDKQCIN